MFPTTHGNLWISRFFSVLAVVEAGLATWWSRAEESGGEERRGEEI
jgi:hypothetical protein